MAREPVSYERKIQDCYKKEQARDCLDIGGQQYVDLTGVFIFELPEQGEELLSKSRLSAQECQIHSRRTYRSNLERKIRKGREEQRGGFLAESLVLLSDLPPPGSLPSSRRKFMANCFKRRRGSTWCTKYSTPGLAAYWKQAWSCSRFCDDTEAVSLLSRVQIRTMEETENEQRFSPFILVDLHYAIFYPFDSESRRLRSTWSNGRGDADNYEAASCNPIYRLVKL